MITITITSRAELTALSEDVARVTLEWARLLEGSDVQKVSETNVRDLGREIADRLEARWLVN